MKEKMLTKLERDRAVGQVSCDIMFFCLIWQCQVILTFLNILMCIVNSL